MGQFRGEFVGISSSHGCARRARPGEKLDHCGHLGCVDCEFYNWLQIMRAKGFTVGEATLTHFPGTSIEVIDDLKTKTRKRGQF